MMIMKTIMMIVILTIMKYGEYDNDNAEMIMMIFCRGRWLLRRKRVVKREPRYLGSCILNGVFLFLDGVFVFLDDVFCILDGVIGILDGVCGI